MRVVRECSLWLAPLLCGAAGLRGVLLRESLVPPFSHSDASGRRVASAHWDQDAGARTHVHFVRLVGGSSPASSLWTVEPLGEAALSAELALRLAGDGPGAVAAVGAAAVGLWFAENADASPGLVAALAALPGVEVSTGGLVAVGIVFAADGARIIAAGANGTIAHLTAQSSQGLDDLTHIRESSTQAPRNLPCTAPSRRRARQLRPAQCAHHCPPRARR
mmetsp:Transcript_5220/g.15482  ORF Transcript_5220/g.15482 Transcript_5220/m.15482 type:complete len:220 (-) Transcript_5220:825-1484(-)